MELDDLIERVRGDDPLARVSGAMGVKHDLDDLADELVGHFVDEARRAGHSWSEIGAAMGVTKQAAQQRHTNERPPRWRGRMFTRFTEKAKLAVERAGAAADRVEVEHLLQGVLSVRDSTGSVVLGALGVTAAAELGRGRRHTRFTPEAKQVIEQALREALAARHGFVGTEHLVLAVHHVQPDLLPGVTRDQLLDEIAKHGVAA